MAWSKRKPYLHLKLSSTEFFSSPVRYIKEFFGKESEMEKPYLGTGRSEMHLDIPDYNWPPFPYYPLRDWEPPDLLTPPLIWPLFQNPDDPPFTDPEDPPMEGRDVPGGFSPTEDPPFRLPPQNQWDGPPPIDSLWIQPDCMAEMATASDCLDIGDTVDIIIASGAVGKIGRYGFEISHPDIVSGTLVKGEVKGTRILRLTVIAEPEETVTVRIEVFMAWITPLGSLVTTRCETFSIVVPCSCLDPLPLVCDTAVEKITRPVDPVLTSTSTLALGILGGEGPYFWSVSGSGFCLDFAKTEGLANTLRADSSACGTADITVFDSCGQQVTGYVRSPDGQWVNKSSTCVLRGAQQGTTGNYFYYISGKGRQRQQVGGAGGGSCRSPAACATQCDDHSDAQGPLITCLTGDLLLETWCYCHEEHCDPGEEHSTFVNPFVDLKYDEWECI